MLHVHVDGAQEIAVRLRVHMPPPDKSHLLLRAPGHHGTRVSHAAFRIATYLLRQDSVRHERLVRAEWISSSQVRESLDPHPRGVGCKVMEFRNESVRHAQALDVRALGTRLMTHLATGGVRADGDVVSNSASLARPHLAIRRKRTQWQHVWRITGVTAPGAHAVTFVTRTSGVIAPRARATTFVCRISGVIAARATAVTFAWRTTGVIAPRYHAVIFGGVERRGGRSLPGQRDGAAVIMKSR